MDDEVKKKEEYVLDNDCPTCGASLKYNPKTKSWLCEFCHVNYSLEELKKHNNASSDKHNKIENSKKDDKTDLTIYKCSNCGAEIVCDETVAATFCVYCRSTAILKSKLSGEFKPDFVIPFKVEKKKVEEAFVGIAKKRPFIPKFFTSPTNIEKIKGVYIPFWLYDVNVSGLLDISATKIRSWNSGRVHYTETSKYSVLRDVTMNFDNVPVDGSTRFENDVMNSIEPFDYNEMVEYNHAYLSGFLAEKYDVEKDNAYTDAENRCKNSSLETVLSSVRGYTSQRINQNTLTPTNISHKYVLLPVWMVNVKYGNKLHIFAMNGQTGKFVGNIPIDKKKAFLYFILYFTISFAFCLLINFVLFKLGD